MTSNKRAGRWMLATHVLCISTGVCFGAFFNGESWTYFGAGVVLLALSIGAIVQWMGAEHP